MCVYIYIYIYIRMHISMYIYIYIKREREREKHIYIYIKSNPPLEGKSFPSDCISGWQVDWLADWLAGWGWLSSFSGRKEALPFYRNKGSLPFCKEDRKDEISIWRRERHPPPSEGSLSPLEGEGEDFPHEKETLFLVSQK